MAFRANRRWRQLVWGHRDKITSYASRSRRCNAIVTKQVQRHLSPSPPFPLLSPLFLLSLFHDLFFFLTFDQFARHFASRAFADEISLLMSRIGRVAVQLPKKRMIIERYFAQKLENANATSFSNFSEWNTLRFPLILSRLDIFLRNLPGVEKFEKPS